MFEHQKRLASKRVIKRSHKARVRKKIKTEPLVGFMQGLPIGVLQHVCSFFGFRDLIALENISHATFAVLDEPALVQWRLLNYLHFTTPGERNESAAFASALALQESQLVFAKRFSAYYNQATASHMTLRKKALLLATKENALSDLRKLKPSYFEVFITTSPSLTIVAALHGYQALLDFFYDIGREFFVRQKAAVEPQFLRAYLVAIAARCNQEVLIRNFVKTQPALTFVMFKAYLQKSAIFNAASHGHVKLVDRILQARPKGCGQRALQLALLAAVIDGHTPVVKRLLEEGVSVRNASYEGHTAMMFAKKQSKKEIYEMLRKAGQQVGNFLLRITMGRSV